MEQAEIIALTHQTLPALGAYGDALTQDFYAHLFAHNPELKHTFNMANQASGTQARALLDAIILFVSKLDQLDTLGPQARMIAAKHVSLDIQPAHYALVGASLLATFAEKLGPAATPAVMQAWELAYMRIVAVLTGLEATAYQGHRTQPGGWLAFKGLRVARTVAECADIRSFYLVAPDGQPLPAYRPGQFVSVAVQVPGQPYRQIRQYSLSDAPGQPYYRLTVRRQPAGHETPAGLVSNYLHDDVRTGDTLLVHAPAGEFHLNVEVTTPLVLLAGGVGITPLMAMLEQELATDGQREIRLLHAVRDADSQLFAQRLRHLAQQHPRLRTFTLYQHVPAEVAGPDEAADQPEGPLNYGLLTAEHLLDFLADLPRNADCYCCGPLGFMRHTNQLLRQQGFTHRHFEVFGPSQSLD
ncbi:MAG: globin domain-containing protein [Janthinobacterium lividum]